MNFATFIVAAILAFVIAMIIINLIKKSKKGCGGDCAHCGAACAPKKTKTDELDKGR